MKAKFSKSEGDYLQAEIEVSGVTLFVMDEFGGTQLTKNDIIDVELVAGLFHEDEEWESMFAGNPEKKRLLEHQSGWCYRAYGIVTAIKPDVLVDVGIAELEAPIDTNDERVIGESVAFTITRLGAYCS